MEKQDFEDVDVPRNIVEHTMESKELWTSYETAVVHLAYY